MITEREINVKSLFGFFSVRPWPLMDLFRVLPWVQSLKTPLNAPRWLAFRVLIYCKTGLILV